MASYRAAVEWIADNDDQDLGEPDSPLVSICMIADLWDKEPSQVHADVARRRRSAERRRSA